MAVKNTSVTGDFGTKTRILTCKLCADILTVYFVGGANDGTSVHAEIDTIVDSAFNNLKSTGNIVPTLDEPLRKTEVSPSHPAEHTFDKTYEGSQQENLYTELLERTDVDVRQQQQPDMKLKGDMTSSEVFSAERYQRMDLREESFHKTLGTSSQRISEQNSDRVSLHHGADDNKLLHGSESIESPHESVVIAESDKQSDVLGTGSDVNEAPSLSMHRSNAEHNISRDHLQESDIPESADNDAAANSHSIDHEKFHDSENEQLLQNERAGGVISEDKEGLLMPDLPAGKDTFPGDVDRKVEEVREVAESSSDDDDEAEMQETQRSVTVSLHKNSDRTAEEQPELTEEGIHKSYDDDDDDEDNDEMQTVDDSVEENTAADAVGEETVNIKDDPAFYSEEHSDIESNAVDEKLSHNVDEHITPVLDADSASTELDDGSSGWSYSALSAVCSFTDAIIDMVSPNTFKNIFFKRT